MKARDLANYLLGLSEEQLEMEIAICTGGYECDPTTEEVEVNQYIEQHYSSEVGKYVNYRTLLTFTDKEPEKPIQGEVVKEYRPLGPNPGLLK